MEFNVKLQELRKNKGITQDELAEALYVSRTAVSKWESGRGYPNIDSLKAIAKFFGVTIDELLSGDELLSLAEQDNKQRESCFCDLIFGLLDICALLFLFLPLFAQRTNGVIEAVSLLNLTEISPYLKTVYFDFVALMIIFGVLTLALQNCSKAFWGRVKRKISLILNIMGAVVFIISLQPYPAIFLFVFLVIKALILIKKR